MRPGMPAPYFDAAVVIAKDPETGVRNASIQRFLVVNKTTLAINIDAGRHLGLYLEKAAAKGEALPLTINVGVGPGLHFAAAAPAEAAPADQDELGIASAFHGAPLELVAGIKTDVEMIANAMYALECENPAGRDSEGGAIRGSDRLLRNGRPAAESASVGDLPAGEPGIPFHPVG